MDILPEDFYHLRPSTVAKTVVKWRVYFSNDDNKIEEITE
jgi:hypothetical protein